MTKAGQNQLINMINRLDSKGKRMAWEERQDYYAESHCAKTAQRHTGENAPTKKQIQTIDNPPTEKQIQTICRMARHHPTEQVDWATLTKQSASELIGRWIAEWKRG